MFYINDDLNKVSNYLYIRKKFYTNEGWNSMMKSITEKGKNGTFNPPSFSHIYQLRSTEVTGNFTWYGYNVKLLRKVDNVDLYQQAKAFHTSIKGGQGKAAEKDDTNF